MTTFRMPKEDASAQKTKERAKPQVVMPFRGLLNAKSTASNRRITARTVILETGLPKKVLRHATGYTP